MPVQRFQPDKPPVRWWERLFSPVDIAPLVWFRVAFGALMLYDVWRYLSLGRLGRYYAEPAMHFKYYGFGWVQPWPGMGMHLHYVALGTLAVLIMAGLCYRVATVLFFLGFTYVFLLDQTQHLNHFYLVCLYSFLLIFMPANRTFSLDAWWRPARRSPVAPAWSLWLPRFQMCVVYFYGGIAKINGDWLQAEPLRAWLARRGHIAGIGPWLTTEWMPWVLSYGGLIFDLAIAPLLIWRRTRWLAFGLAAGFNLFNAWIFNIGIFPWLALGASVLLFAERLPKPFPRAWSAAETKDAAEAPRADGWLRPSPGARRVVFGLAGAYVAFQLLMPLRHWAYPGDVAWTEQGHRFSWRMKLRSKKAQVGLMAHDPDSGRTWVIDPLEVVTPRQLSKLGGRPDMVLQLCHHVADDFRERGFPNIEVYANVMASLNGRPPQPLVNPEVNLAAEPRSLRPAHWIMPGPGPLRPGGTVDAEGLDAADGD